MRDTLDRSCPIGLNRTLTVNRLSKRVNDSSDHRVAYRYLRNLAGTLDQIAFFYMTVISQENRTDIILFQVQYHSHDSSGKFQQFSRHRVLQSIDTGDTVAHCQNCPDLIHG